MMLSTSPTAGAAGVDVVLIIDQSGSMSGSSVHPVANDRHGHRMALAEVVLSRLAQSVDESPLRHLVSIVEFGSTVEVPVSAEEFAHDPADKGRAVALAHSASGKLRPRVMGDTHTHEAFSAALHEFELMAAKSGRAPDRTRHLLLVTDGRPYAEENGVPLTTTELWRRLGDETKRLSTLGVSLWVVGLDGGGRYWPVDGPRWSALAGDPKRVARVDDVFPQLQKLVSGIVADWLGTSSIAPLTSSGGSRIALPPYLGRAVFEVHAREPLSTPRVTGPDGRTVPLQSSGASGLVSFHVADAPPPGEYKAEGTRGVALLALASSEPPRISKVSPGREVAKGVPTTIRFKATGISALVPLKEDPNHPIRAEVEVADPSGKLERLPAGLDADGIFSAVWTPGVTGEHALSLRATYRADDGTQQPLGSVNAAHAVTVAEAPLALSVLAPDLSGTIAAAPGGDGVKFELALVEGDGAELDADAHLTDPDTWLRAWPVDESGVAVGPAVPVGYSDRRFHFTLPVSFDVWRGEGWLRPVSVSFRLVADEGRLLGGRKLSELKLPPEAAGLRVQGDPLSAGPMAVSYPIWVLGGLWAAVLALFASALSAFYVLAGRDWLLALVDARRGEELELAVFELSKDPACQMPVKRIQLGGKSKMDLAGSIRRRIPGKDPQVFERLVVKRSWRNGGVAQVHFAFNGNASKSDLIRLFLGAQGKDLPPNGDEKWRLQLRKVAGRRAGARATQ